MSCLSTDGVRRKHFSWSMYEKPPRNNSGTKNTKKSYLLGKPVFMPYLPTDGVCRKHCLCSIHEDHSPELIQGLKIQKITLVGKTSFCALSSNRRHPPKTLLMVYTRKPLPELIQGLKIHKNYSCARNQFLCAIFQRMGSNERTINVLCMISPPRINSGTKNTKKIVLVEKPFYFATYATPVTRWGPTKSAHGLLTNTVP